MKQARSISAEASRQPEPVWVRISTAAALLDMTPKAFSMRVSRGQLPAEIVRRFGDSVRVHREKLLAWFEAGCQTPAPLSRVP